MDDVISDFMPPSKMPNIIYIYIYIYDIIIYIYAYMCHFSPVDSVNYIYIYRKISYICTSRWTMIQGTFETLYLLVNHVLSIHCHELGVHPRKKDTPKLCQVSQHVSLVKNHKMLRKELRKLTLWPWSWANCNDLTSRPSPGIMVNKGNHPQIALIQVGELL